jgi:glucokinase
MGQSECVVGIDIGGTKTAVGLVDRQGQCLSEASIPTNASEPAVKLIKRIVQTIEKLSAPMRTRRPIKGIGIGAPNANYYQGTVEHPPNLNWPGITDVAAMFRKHYTVPVALTNDANAAALGELLFGAGKGLRDFIVITLGTGLGSGLVVNGALVYGHDGFAGEIGHTTVDPDGRECGCGRKGCLETYASATGICRTVFELLSMKRDDSILRSIAYRDLTSKMISDAALQGDAIAREAFDYTGRVLGMKLADSVAHTSPSAIIMFGGLAAAGTLIFEPTKRHMEANLLPIFRNKVRLLPSGLKESNAAVLGSAALIWNELETK